MTPHGGDRPTAEKCVAEAATLVMEVGSGDRVHSSTTEEKVELLKPIVTWKAIIDFLEPNNVCVQRPDDLENARRRVTAIAANATVNVVSRRSDRDRAHCVSWSIGTRDDRTHLCHAGVTFSAARLLGKPTASCLIRPTGQGGRRRLAVATIRKEPSDFAQSDIGFMSGSISLIAGGTVG